MFTEAKHRRFERKVLCALAAIFLSACTDVLQTESARAASAAADTSVRREARKPASTFDVQGLERSRQIIKYNQENPQPKKKGVRKSKPVPESTIIEYFQDHPEALKSDLAKVVRELNERSRVVDTTKHVRLIPPAGKPGYEDLRVFVSHRYRLGEKEIPADDLAKVWRDFIVQAKKEIVLNVFEFDLESIADELIRAHQRKINVQVGVDGNLLKKNPRDRAVSDRMKAAGIKVVEVDSVGLNHQKMMAIDWSQPDLARALFSSGNLTKSCLSADGDLDDLNNSDDSKKTKARVLEANAFAKARAIPNANHIITMKSWLTSNLIHHELTKTFSKELGLRGSAYPTSGAFQITGPGVDPQTFEAYPENSFIIAFTPGGGYREVNRNILAYLIKKSEGPIRMVQFAFSAKDVAAALLERAQRDIQKTGKFDFQSVGDTAFAMQKWSQFLKMSGLKRTSKGRGKDKVVRFEGDTENPWVKSLTEDQLIALRKNIRVAPAVYGRANVRIGNNSYDLTSKIHHKIMSMGDFAIIGTSFNFSNSAETNNEQLLVFRDPKMAAIVQGITSELAGESPRSVYEEAERRMARENMSVDISYEDEVDDENVTAETILPAAKNSR